MPSLRQLAVIALLLGTAVLASGCGRSVAVQPPANVDPTIVAVCQRLQEALPNELTAGRSWPVEPESSLTAAWASPAVVLRCGVGDPSALSPTSQLIVIDGVDWFSEELTDGTRLTTVGRVANVELVVPRDYAPAATTLAEIGPAVASAIPEALSQ